MFEVTPLVCPQCGGKLSEGAAPSTYRCEWCGTISAAVLPGERMPFDAGNAPSESFDMLAIAGPEMATCR